MRRTIAVRTSATIGLVLGVLSVVAGGRVLADIDRPDYVVLHWLVIYNVAAGFVGVVAGAGLWLSRGWATESRDGSRFPDVPSPHSNTDIRISP